MITNSRVRQLLAIISNRERGSSSPNVIESGDFKIDLSSRTVTLLGERLELTSEEFDVLVFVANHPQRFVSPHTMLATNCTKNAPHRTEFFRVLMELRKKLDAASSGNHYLRTEPWIIYRFDPTAAPRTDSSLQRDVL